MMKFLPYIVLLLPFTIWAVEVVRMNDKILLKDPSCKEAKEIGLSIMEWAKNTDPQINCPELPEAQKKLSKKECAIDISSCVPNHVAKYQGLNPKFAGPNCWNLALVMKGILPNLRYTSASEMAFYMQPPLCRQLKNGEKKMPGDVGAIRVVKDANEYHGFIYISEKIAYSKNGYLNSESNNSYALQPLENVYRVYDVPAKKECRQNELSHSEKCPEAVSYFRCISINQYLKENPEIPTQVMNAYQNVSAIENCFEARAIKGEVLTPAIHEIVESNTKALTFFLREELKKSNLLDNPEELEKTNFLLGSIKLRLWAIGKQLEYSKDDQLSQEVINFANSIEKAIQQLNENSTGE